MAEDYDPFSAAEDAYDPFAAADAPAPALPPVAIDASQIAAALALDAAKLRGELESKTKQAVEMQKRRDAETAARKAQAQAAAAARAAERRARVLGSTELTPDGVARCIEAAICAVLRWPPPGGLARWTVAALTPWLDAPAAEVQQRIAGRSRSRSPRRRGRYDTALPRRRSRSPRRSPGKRSRSRSRPRRDTKRSRFDGPRVISKAAAAAREAAELAGLSDGALRDQWQRVVKAAVLEVLAELPPNGAPHWRLADLTGRVGASRRALEDGIAKVAPARAAARRVLARCLGDSGRFHDISDGCGFASFARKQPYLRVVGFHADAAVHAVEVQAAEEGEADEARAPLAVGDRVRRRHALCRRHLAG